MQAPSGSSADDYDAIHSRAVLGNVAPRAAILLTGADRASYLHGLLTNDIKALAPGQGCYAAWLTPQGRMMTDLYVYELGSSMLIDVPADLAGAILERLDQFLFSEDVQLADASSTHVPVCVHGPAAARVLADVLENGVADYDAWTECQNAAATFAGSPVIVTKVSTLGVPGFCVYTARASELRRALETAGAVAVSPGAIETARIEAGYPVFGVDLTHDTIPLEAGIEDRAISFTKGCYVGQEVIVRVLHRGHGRVARKLVGLQAADFMPARGTRIRMADREIGHVTSAAHSPRLGAVAIGYVHRDFTAPGTHVDLDTPASGHAQAIVVALPFPATSHASSP